MTLRPHARRRAVAFALLSAFTASLAAQAPTSAPAAPRLLQPARVFDGEAMHEGWVVLVQGKEIVAAGPAAEVAAPAGAERVALPGLTLLPGLIEGHSHLLLHPYNETTWNDQVLREPLAYRVARAVVQRPRHLDGRHHHRARPGHRGRRLRRRRPQAVDPGRHRARAADARGRSGDGRHRQLRAEGLRARGDRAAGRRGGRRPRGRGSRHPQPDRPRRGLHQDLRRLPLGAQRRGPADLQRRGDHPHRRDRPQQRPLRGGARRHRRGHAPGDRRRAWRRSTTATPARPKCGS